MAAGAEPGTIDVAVALFHRQARLLHGEGIGLIVEGAEAVHAVLPALIAVFVALEAIFVVVEDLRRNEVAGRRAGERREEVLLARFRPFFVPTPRVLGLPDEHQADKNGGNVGPAAAHLPVDLFARQPVQYEEPDGEEGRDDVRPIGDLPHRGVFDDDQPLDTGEHDARGEQHEGGRKKGISNLDGPAVAAVMGIGDVTDAKNEDRHHDQGPEHQVHQEHVEVKPVLVGLAAQPFEQRDAAQVGRVDGQQGEKPEDQGQNLLQPRSHCGDIAPESRCCIRRGCRRVIGSLGRRQVAVEIAHRSLPSQKARSNGLRSSFSPSSRSGRNKLMQDRGPGGETDRSASSA